MFTQKDFGGTRIQTLKVFVDFRRHLKGRRHFKSIMIFEK